MLGLNHNFSLSEGKIEVSLVVLFDTVVIALTARHILGTWRLQKMLKPLEKRSMTRLILKQGESRVLS